MKLRYAPTSPYVRKVVVTLAELGLDDRVERIDTLVWDPGNGYRRDQPARQGAGVGHRRRRRCSTIRR